MPLPDKDAFSTLGGPKVDFVPSEDPTTDLAASADSASRANVAAMTRTLSRAYVAFSSSVVLEHDATWGNDPSVAPVLVHVGTGHWTLAWPATVLDAAGNSTSLKLRRAGGTCEDAGYSLAVQRTGPNTAAAFCTSIATQALADPPNAMNATVW